MLQAHLEFRIECDRASLLAGLSMQSDQLIAALQNDLNQQHTNEASPRGRSERPSREHSCSELFSLGVGYVFEGSALGANIIRKRLSATKLRNPAYLNLVTSTATSRWPRYIKKLDTYNDTESILSGAVMTFEFIIAQAESVQ